MTLISFNAAHTHGEGPGSNVEKKKKKKEITGNSFSERWHMTYASLQKAKSSHIPRKHIALLFGPLFRWPF